MNRILLFYFLLISFKLFSQFDTSFISPIKYQTRLSGSFAEPRTAHFHAGIDFKKNKGVPHDSIFAVGDGIISRINVKPDGYGNSLYIDHPIGYTSVYAHLHSFAPNIEKIIRQKLYSRKVHRIEYYTKSDTIEISKGQFIGIMGNTGRSSAPHLHFEIRETASETPVNPAIFGFKPSDNLRPTIMGIVIYSLGPNMEVFSKRYIEAKYIGDGQYVLEEPIITTKALSVGIGIHCYDTMNGANNHNGIYGIKSSINGIPFYAFELNKVSFDETKYIHAHMDYEAKKNNKYISTCFRSKLNPLGIYDQKLSNGLIMPTELIPQSIDIVAYDFDQNESNIRFQIIRDDSLTPLVPIKNDSSIRIIPVDSMNISVGSFNVSWPSGTFEKPTYININQRDKHQLELTSVNQAPLFNYMKLSAEIDSMVDKSKLVFSAIDDKSKVISYGGEWENESKIITYINELQSYTLVLDSIPPSIQIISLPNENNDRIAFVLSDNLEPNYSRDYLNFELLIDGNWTLCQHDIKANKVWHYLEIPRNKINHTLSFKVKDSCNNETIITRSFVY